MLGVAQKLFADRCGRMPWKRSLGSGSWPILERLLSEGARLHLEITLARQILCDYPEVDEAAAAFLCHLCLAARQGHLCVVVDESGVQPSPQRLWSEMLLEGSPLAEDNLLEEVTALVRAGSSKLPAGVVGFDASSSAPVIKSGSSYYLKRFWTYEMSVAQQVCRLLGESPARKADLGNVSNQVAALLDSGQLNSLQAQAIIKASTGCFTIVTGGPGTGKTYVAGYLIRLLWEALHDLSTYEIVAAAPTGKASANLAASLVRALSGLTDPPRVKSKTLHSLLEVNKRHFEGAVSLTADLIIVDESSMVDVQMMSRLLKAVKNGARLILLGDSEQLPAVEAGGVFADLTASLEKSCVVRLEQCLRTDSIAILEAAASIRDGDVYQLRQVLSSNAQELHFHEWTEGADAYIWNAILEHSASFLHYSNEDSVVLLEQMNRRRILTPLREGPWGVKTLNDRLLEWVRGHQQGPCSVLPIMVVVNDYSKELFNGDVGVLIEDGKESYALFLGTKGVRRFPEVTLPRYEYAFALSVHKSQGSEFDEVLLLLPPRSEVFGRELLYTAVTRAKKRLDIIGASTMLDTLVQRPMERLSGLRDRLW